jgi:hypothetical protein
MNSSYSGKVGKIPVVEGVLSSVPVWVALITGKNLKFPLMGFGMFFKDLPLS